MSQVLGFSLHLYVLLRGWNSANRRGRHFARAADVVTAVNECNFTTSRLLDRATRFYNTYLSPPLRPPITINRLNQLAEQDLVKIYNDLPVRIRTALSRNGSSTPRRRIDLDKTLTNLIKFVCVIYNI